MLNLFSGKLQVPDKIVQKGTIPIEPRTKAPHQEADKGDQVWPTTERAISLPGVRPETVAQAHDIVAQILAAGVLTEIGLSQNSVQGLNLNLSQIQERMSRLSEDQLVGVLTKATGLPLTPAMGGLKATMLAVERKLTQWLFGPKTYGDPALTHAIERRDETTYHAAPMLQDNSIITKDGVRLIPLPLAAWQAHATEPTIRTWIEKRVKFGGRALKTYISPTTKGLYVTEDSVQRMAERFVKWPSGEPAGPIVLGEADNQRGFLGMPDAARIVGVSPRTMWLWCSQPEKAPPTDKPLDVIKCTTSDYFYLRERDAHHLKSLVPRSGLKRGPRPQMAQPT